MRLTFYLNSKASCIISFPNLLGCLLGSLFFFWSSIRTRISELAQVILLLFKQLWKTEALCSQIDQVKLHKLRGMDHLTIRPRVVHTVVFVNKLKLNLSSSFASIPIGIDIAHLKTSQFYPVELYAHTPVTLMLYFYLILQHLETYAIHLESWTLAMHLNKY